MTTSFHYNRDRQTREDLIKTIGCGTPIKRVEIDKGHRNGPEIHEITSTGIVNIYNKRTGKLITKLIARPGQLRRYYGEERVPTEVWKKAVEHQRNGYNEM